MNVFQGSYILRYMVCVCVCALVVGVVAVTVGRMQENGSHR